MNESGYDFAPVVALLTTGVYGDFDTMAKLVSELSWAEAHMALIALLGMTVELMQFVCESADTTPEHLLVQLGLDST